jgi:vacuolar protein sorting-associated protein 13A/C
MSQIIINHMQQPVLRILDYSLQQLLFALTKPDKTVYPEIDDVVDHLVEVQQQQLRGSQKDISL